MYKIPELFFSFYVTIDFVYETIALYYIVIKPKSIAILMLTLSKSETISRTDKILLEMALERT